MHIQAFNQGFFRAGEVSWNKGTPINILSITHERKGLQEKFWSFFIFLKFQLKVTILIFWTKFVQKLYFWSKTEKVIITIELCILELNWVPNFRIN